MKSLSRVQLFVTPWTVSHPAPLSMGFSRQEYWSGLPFPSLGDLPNPGIEPRSPTLQADALSSDHQGSPYMQSTSREMQGRMNHKLESGLPGKLSITQIWRWYHSNGRKWRGTKEPLDEGERGKWKGWLEIQHEKKTKIMASSSITSWQTNGEKAETVTDLFSWTPKSLLMDCSHKTKRYLFLGGKAMTNLDSVFKSREVTLPTKICISKAMVFPVVMYGWELDHK